jgi:predicted nucleic acid-binding protein
MALTPWDEKGHRRNVLRPNPSRLRNIVVKILQNLIINSLLFQIDVLIPGDPFRKLAVFSTVLDFIYHQCSTHHFVLAQHLRDVVELVTVHVRSRVVRDRSQARLGQPRAHQSCRDFTRLMIMRDPGQDSVVSLDYPRAPIVVRL